MPSLIDISGERYGRLIVLKRDGKKSNGHTSWLCLCECGEKKSISQSHLRSGLVKSCGCLHKESSARNGRNNKTHGNSNSLTYKTWRSILNRCLNVNSDQYSYYGGRGIKICERWMDFSKFIEDMGDRPSKVHTIDRKNRDGNYEPSNCRWATPKEQAINRSSTRIIEAFGERKSLSEWAIFFGVRNTTLSDFLKRGKSIEDYPNRKVIEKILFDGIFLSVSGHAKRLGLSPETIRYRINNGMNLIEALEKPIRKNKLSKEFSTASERGDGGFGSSGHV